jgi:hypothetical protein
MVTRMQSEVSDVVHCVGRPWKHEYSRCNQPYTAEIPNDSDLATAILNFDHVFMEPGVRRCSIASGVPENMTTAVISHTA